MQNKQLLPYISNDKLYAFTGKVLSDAQNAVEDAEARLYTNVIDPFSALFDALRQDISLTQWLEQEKSRQIQKTMQNSLGDFHENIIGAMPGWEKLPVGHVIDVRSMERKVIAEVKTKHNTTKGTDKKSIYDNLKSQLDTPDYGGFTSYYVEVVPKRREPYDKPFTPSDNITHTRRPENQKIRVIDGRSFYKLASGLPDALKMLYEALPTVIGDILKRPPNKVVEDNLFTDLFSKAY